jgi:hypothetical protein
VTLGALGGGMVVSTTTLHQTATPPSLLGRVSAINAVAYGARPMGAAIGALVGALYDAPACLIVGGRDQAIVILASPVPRLARSPLPAAHDPS